MYVCSFRYLTLVVLASSEKNAEYAIASFFITTFEDD